MTSEKATYKSPIEIFINDVNYSMEQTVLEAVSKCGIKVNKDELVKALAYDRQQYEEGYRNAMKQMPKWIPVSERLPEKYQYVLVTYKGLDGTRLVVVTNWNPNTWIDSNSVAWMPVPEPFKGGE